MDNNIPWSRCFTVIYGNKLPFDIIIDQILYPSCTFKVFVWQRFHTN